MDLPVQEKKFRDLEILGEENCSCNFCISSRGLAAASAAASAKAATCPLNRWIDLSMNRLMIMTMLPLPLGRNSADNRREKR